MVACIAGVTAAPGKRLGHAGAVISGVKGTAADEFAALEAARVTTARSPAEPGSAIAKRLVRRSTSKTTEARKTMKLAKAKKTAKKAAKPIAKKKGLLTRLSERRKKAAIAAKVKKAKKKLRKSVKRLGKDVAKVPASAARAARLKK